MPSVSARVEHGEMCRESVLTGKATNFCRGRTYRAQTSLRNLKALLGGLEILKVSKYRHALKALHTHMVKANWPCSMGSTSTRGQMANLLCLAGGKDLQSAPGPETEWYMLFTSFYIFLHVYHMPTLLWILDAWSLCRQQSAPVASHPQALARNAGWIR